MIRFLHPNLEAEFARCPEPLRLVVYELAEWCEHANIISPVVTCVERNANQNKAAGGVPNSLHLRQPSRAVDLRSLHYASWELDRVKAYLVVRCPAPRFELITTPHGTAPHLHIGLEQP